MTTKLFSRICIFFILVSILTSCDLFKGDEDPQIIDEYLVDYELERSYSQFEINIAINLFKNQFPEIDSLSNRIEYGISVYKIVYKTTFEGEEVDASGLVCIPVGNSGPFPLLSFQNGTYTLHSEAPSVDPDRDFYRMLELVSSTGFIISIPDYLGFGASENMFHPYLDAESTVQTVLDMLRAVKELNKNYLDVEMKDELYIAGYSQGGWATMQVQKAIEENFAGEFNLKASACGAGPYDLNYVNEYITDQTTYPMPYFVGYMYNSYWKLGLMTTPANQIFQEPYATKIPTLYDGTKSGAEINAELTTSVADLFTADYLANYKTDSKYSSVVTSLAENSVDAWNTTTPTLLIHGTTDNFVPPQVSTDIYQGFLSAGVNADDVTLLPLVGYGHSNGITPAGLAMILWFMDMQE